MPTHAEHTTYYTYIDTPVGKLMLAGCDDHGLRHIAFQCGKGALAPKPEWKQSAAPFRAVERQLREYFQGKRTDFDLALHPKGTPFQQSVWKALLKIPYGQTRSVRGHREGRRPSDCRSGGRPRQRAEPAPHRRAVPPGDRRQRETRRLRGRAPRQAGAARQGARGQRGASSTTRPPTIVVLTLTSRIRSGAIAKMSSDRMTTSASEPGASVPFSASVNSAYAESGRVAPDGLLDRDSSGPGPTRPGSSRRGWPASPRRRCRGWG